LLSQHQDKRTHSSLHTRYYIVEPGWFANTGMN